VLLLTLGSCQKLITPRLTSTNEQPQDKPAPAEPPAAEPKAPLPPGIPGSLEGLAVSRDGKLVVVVGKDNRLKVWSVPQNKWVLDLPSTSDAPLHALAVSPDGTELAYSAGSDIKLVSLPGGEPLHTFTGHLSPVTCLAITPDGSLLISGGRDCIIRFWS